MSPSEKRDLDMMSGTKIAWISYASNEKPVRFLVFLMFFCPFLARRGLLSLAEAEVAGPSELRSQEEGPFGAAL